MSTNVPKLLFNLATMITNTERMLRELETIRDGYILNRISEEEIKKKMNRIQVDREIIEQKWNELKNS